MKCVAILLTLLLSIHSFGQGLLLNRFINQTSDAGEACATSDTLLAHDELLEGFEGDGYELTWTEGGTTANITEGADSSALTANKPLGACDKAWKIVVPTDGTETWATWDRGSAIDPAVNNIDSVFYFYVESGPDTATEEYSIFQIGGSSSATPSSTSNTRIILKNNAGNITIRASSSVNSAEITVATPAQWNKVAVHFNTTAGSSTITLNDGTPQSFTRAATTVRYFHLGPGQGLDANENGTIWMDVVAVDTP